MISDENLLKDIFETAEFWRFVGLTAILRLLQRKNSTFILFHERSSFYCCLRVEVKIVSQKNIQSLFTWELMP